MENIAYKNRKKEINDLINILLDSYNQIVLYESHSGYGNTAFISRLQYILHKTSSLQLFYAELSAKETNPLHSVTKKVINTNGYLYQQLQVFTDEVHGVYNERLSVSLIKDITQSDTLASLFESKSALPIYSGFYQDRLKEIFFNVIDEITKTKKVIFFIDNVQFIDNESIYELQALLKNNHVKLVLFKSGNGVYFDKFYYETKFKFSYIEIPFPAPNINYVKELSTLYNKKISDNEAELILFKANKDIRKILYYLRETNMENMVNEHELQFLKLIFLYDGYIDAIALLKICQYGPYNNIYTKDVINNILNILEEKGYLQSIIIFKDKSKKYRLTNTYTPTIDIADKLVLNKSLLAFYNKEKEIDYKHLNIAWEIASQIGYVKNCRILSIQIIKIALKMGYSVDEKIIETAKEVDNAESQILLATLLFCQAKYKASKAILEKYIQNKTFNRAIQVMFAITLNRCREHSLAQSYFSTLITTSENIDELTVLVTFLISNHIHDNKLLEANNLFETYQPKLISSRKYPYFLRNSATLFATSKAYELRHTAINLFKKEKDLFGYYSTIINTASYYLNNVTTTYAISQILMAFEGLQQFNASQIHLAANNLGVCYLLDNNYLQANKYLELSRSTAKTIMPITYATINLSGMYLKVKKYKKAFLCIQKLNKHVIKSNLPRLKARYFLHKAFVEYVQGNYYQSRKDCIFAQKYSSPLAKNNIINTVNLLINYMDNGTIYSDILWSKLFTPCFLEYWTINSVDIFSDDLLSF